MSQATTVSAVVAGVAQGILTDRGTVAQVDTAFTGPNSVAAAIAAEVWALTLDVGASASSAALLTAITAGITAGRGPTSVTAADYAVVAGTIKAAYTKFLTSITP